MLGANGLGGVTIYISNIVNNIDNINFHVAINIEKDFYRLNEIFTNCNLINFKIEYSLNNIHSRIKELNNVVTQNNIDIIHSHTLRAGLLTAIYKFIFNKKIKLIYTGHGLRYDQKNKYLSKLIFRFLEIFVNKISNHAIYIRKYDYNLAIKEHINSYRKSSIINTRISLANLDENSNLRKDYNINTKYIIANIASIYSLKNPELFISIAKLALKDRDDITFVWIGDGLEKDKYTEFIKNEKLENKIKFIGAISNSKSINYLKDIDILLLTSKIETFPLIVLEAFMTNTLAIVTNYKGAEDIITNNINGIIFDMNSPIECMNIIKNILSNKDIYECLTKNAYNDFIASYKDVNTFAEEHLKIYNKLTI